jgi:hypothetical protein
MKVRKSQTDETFLEKGPGDTYILALRQDFSIIVASATKEDNKIKIVGWKIHNGEVKKLVSEVKLKIPVVTLNSLSLLDVLNENLKQNDSSHGEGIEGKDS